MNKEQAMDEGQSMDEGQAMDERQSADEGQAMDERQSVDEGQSIDEGQVMDKDRIMDKEEQVMMGFRNVYNKMVWLNTLKMKDRFEDYKSSEVHCIEYIGENADSNVTKLAEFFYMTSGAISKMTKKLMTKGIIESYQKPDNKKEIYFRLTEHGKAIYKVHEELHKELRERDKAVFDQVTEEQFDDMLRFVEKYSRHLDAEIKKLGTDIKPE